MLQHFVECATSARSTFHTEKAESRPVILHAQGSSIGYEEARDAIEKDMETILRSLATQKNSMTYSVHYSDVNGLSRLENYILGLEIANYLSEFSDLNIAT